MSVELKGVDAAGAGLALGRTESFRPPFGATGSAGRLADHASKWVDQSGLSYWWADNKPVSVPLSSQSKPQLFLKRFADVAISLLAIIGLSPVLLVLALLIKLESPGPVLFRQSREGLHGRIFQIYKFRSMRTDECDQTGVAQTKAGDSRVTPLGRLMRRRSLDELPQLFNVLLGDMSLVGPRPHVANMLAGGMRYDELVPYYELRHTMRPGLTGWAQANGLRGTTDDPLLAKGRIDHDIAYIQNFSCWLDLNCMIRTVKNEFFMGSGV